MDNTSLAIIAQVYMSDKNTATHYISKFGHGFISNNSSPTKQRVFLDLIQFIATIISDSFNIASHCLVLFFKEFVQVL